MQYLELPEATRASLLRGLLEHAWRRRDLAPEWLAEHDAVCEAEVCDVRAYDDGRRLRVALDGVVAAGSFAELNVAEQVYDDVARELNGRYGQGLVVLSHEDGELGVRGFRGQGLATESSVLVGETLHRSLAAS